MNETMSANSTVRLTLPVAEVRGLAVFEGVQGTMFVCHIARRAQIILQTAHTLP